ncbi:MAG: hypothetical protein AAF757_05660 [Cyanobacteria bacterium P01_D01_bin.116]
MNPQTQENLKEYRLQKLVNQIDSDSVEVAPLPILQTSELSCTGIPLYIRNIANWFYYLPAIAKLVAVFIGLLLGFAILQAALKLIASVISMSLLAGLVYLGYNFFVASDNSQIKE